MSFKITCEHEDCHTWIWIQGHTEEDVNAVVFNESDERWDEACEHIKAGENFEIIDSEYDDIED